MTVERMQSHVTFDIWRKISERVGSGPWSLAAAKTFSPLALSLLWDVASLVGRCGCQPRLDLTSRHTSR
jgi:hypothetical protein